jgi:hypothetical protein
MTQKVIGASLSSADQKYPIIVTTMDGWNKLSRDEAINLVGELLDAVNQLDRETKTEWKEAA